MAVWPGSTGTDPVIFAGEPSGAIEPDALPPMPWLVNGLFAGVGTWVEVPHLPAVVVELWPSTEAMQSAGTFEFFEDFHVVPRAFDFGNLLGNQSTPIEVFSGFRHATHTWQAFVNNAGAGVALGGAPSLPVSMPPLTGHQMTLDVSAVGSPFVDTTLDFVFDIGTIYVPIEIQRIVLFGLEPELPYSEYFDFLTDVLMARDGTEQRISLRKSPRHVLGYHYKIDSGSTRETLENLLYDWQARVFGVPVWRYASTVTVAASIGATTITVDQTAFRDFRVGGLAAIFTSQQTYDALVIQSIAATSITFTSPTINAHAVGTRVMPLATCTATQVISGERWPVNLGAIGIEFTNTQNDVDLASTAPFSTFNSKVLLDNFNSLRSGTMRETFEHQLLIIDNGSGVPVFEAIWDRHKRGHLFTLRAQGLQAIWEMIGLIYALRGRQVSFYVPVATENLVVTADLLNASNTMTVSNYGYAQFVRHRQPKNAIRINFNNGNPPLLRFITGSSNIDAATDQLTVDTNWPSTIPFGTIERVEYVEEVRLDTDSVEVEFEESGVRAYMSVPVRAVFE